MKNIILRSARPAAAFFAALLALSVFTGCPDLNGGGGGDPVQEAADGFKKTNAGVLAKTAGTVTTDDEAAVNEALDAYEALDPAAKVLLGDQKVLLDSLKSKIDALKAAAAFENANTEVLGKLVGEITDADVAEVRKVLDAYEALSADAKAALSDEAKDKLPNLKKRVDQLTAAAFTTANTEVLEKPVGEIKKEDVAKVQEVLDAYEALSADVKAALSDDTKTKLANLKTKVDQLTANDVAAAFENANTEVLGKPVGEITDADVAEVRKVLDAYEALNDYAKEALSDKAKAQLDALKAKIDELEGGEQPGGNEGEQPGGTSPAPGKAGITLVDPFEAPDASLTTFTLKQGASNGDERHTLTLDVDNAKNPKWYVDNVLLGNTKSVTLYAKNYMPGGHYVSVEFEKDGKVYDTGLVFTVEAEVPAGGGE
jgi:DNA-binding transcriptional MerR regulator